MTRVPLMLLSRFYSTYYQKKSVAMQKSKYMFFTSTNSDLTYSYMDSNDFANLTLLGYKCNHDSTVDIIKRYSLMEITEI